MLSSNDSYYLPVLAKAAIFFLLSHCGLCCLPAVVCLPATAKRAGWPFPECRQQSMEGRNKAHLTGSPAVSETLEFQAHLGRHMALDQGLLSSL